MGLRLILSEGMDIPAVGDEGLLLDVEAVAQEVEGYIADLPVLGGIVLWGKVIAFLIFTFLGLGVFIGFAHLVDALAHRLVTDNETAIRQLGDTVINSLLDEVFQISGRAKVDLGS